MLHDYPDGRFASASGEVRHLVARRVLDHTALLGRLATRSGDFR